jgi:hypothetical protein
MANANTPTEKRAQKSRATVAPTKSSPSLYPWREREVRKAGCPPGNRGGLYEGDATRRKGGSVEAIAFDGVKYLHRMTSV